MAPIAWPALEVHVPFPASYSHQKAWKLGAAWLPPCSWRVKEEPADVPWKHLWNVETQLEVPAGTWKEPRGWRWKGNVDVYLQPSSSNGMRGFLRSVGDNACPGDASSHVGLSQQNPSISREFLQGNGNTLSLVPS